MSTVKAISGIGEIPEDFLESAFNCRIQAFKNSGQQTVKKYDKELLFLMKKDNINAVKVMVEQMHNNQSILCSKPP